MMAGDVVSLDATLRAVSKESEVVRPKRNRIISTNPGMVMELEKA